MTTMAQQRSACSLGAGSSSSRLGAQPLLRGPAFAACRHATQRLEHAAPSRSCIGCREQQQPSSGPRRPRACTRAAIPRVVCAAGVSEQGPGKTVIVKNTPGDMPFPWSEKDPYKLPVSIDRVQKLLLSSGWEKPWVEQIIDRVMKGMLRTTEERAKAVIDYLVGLGLKSDEVCNMASISVVLLGLNPETRLKPVVDYLKQRGVPSESIPDLLLKHPRIFEYVAKEGAPYLTKGKARIQVDVIPGMGKDGHGAAAVNYFREGASFLESPVAPSGPLNPSA